MAWERNRRNQFALITQFIMCVYLLTNGVYADAKHSELVQKLRDDDNLVASNILVTWPPHQTLPIIIIGSAIYTVDMHRVMTFGNEMGGIEYARWNKAGDRLLVGDKESLTVINFQERHVIRTFTGTADACWTKEGLLRIIHSPFSISGITLGKRTVFFPKNIDVTATTDDGTCFLGWQSHKAIGNGLPRLEAILLFRTQGTKIAIRKVNSISFDTGSKNPYGDQLVANRHAMIISACTTTMRDKTYGTAYSIDLNTMRAFILTKPSCFIQSPLTLFRGAIYGLLRCDSHGASSQTPSYYRVLIQGKSLYWRKRVKLCIGYAHREGINEEAYVELGDNILAIKVYASGRPIAWKTYNLSELH